MNLFVRVALSHTCLLILSMAGSALAQATQGASPTCPGDVNLDGERNSGDLTLLSSHLSGLQTLQGDALANADVNLDFVVDVGDLTRLVQHTSGEWPLLPCGPFVAEEVACPQVSLEVGSAVPLARVAVGSLPEEFSERVVALVVTEDDKFSVTTVVERGEEGTVSLFVPFYPGGAPGGGAVTVQLTDGFVACQPIEFSIAAIPAAPGEFSRVLDALQDLIDFVAETLSLTPEDLLAEGPDLPPVAIPLALARRVLDDPDDPGTSLRAILSGSFLESELDLAFLDAAVAHMGVMDLVGVDFGETGGGQSTSGGPTNSVDVKQCNQSVQKLSQCMQVAVSAQNGEIFERAEGQKNKASNITKAIGVGLTLTGYGGQEGLGPALEAGLASSLGAGTTLAATKWAEETLAGLLPSVLSKLDLELMPPILEEDRVEPGSLTAQLYATSRGWKLDPKRLANYLESGEGRAVKEFFFSDYLPNDALPPKLSPSQDLMAKVIQTVKDKGKEVNEAGGDVLEIPPERFGPVSLPGSDWKTTDVIGDAVSLNEGDADMYKGMKKGTSQIQARVRTDGGRFGGVSSISGQKPVEVKPILLTIEPSSGWLEPGDEGELVLTVKNSFFPEQIAVKAERGTVTSTYERENKHILHYTAPGTADPEPDTVTATHTAKTGARQFSEEERTGKAKIRIVQVIVTGKGCVEPGKQEPEPFKAEVVGGGTDQQVSWSASAGEISQSGRFTAPGAVGNVVITATSQGYKDVTGQTVVRVGPCDCWWTLSLGADIISGTTGVDFGTFPQSGPTLDFIAEMVRSPGPEQESLNLIFSRSSDLWAVQGDIGGSFFSRGFEDNQYIFGKLTENTDQVVEGEVSGTVLVFDGPSAEEREDSFSVKFRFFDDPGFSKSIYKGCTVQ